MTRLLLASVLVAATSFAQRVPWVSETPSIPSNLPGDPAVLLTPKLTVVGTDTIQPQVFFWPVGQAALSYPAGPANSADARETLVAVGVPASNTVLLFAVTDAGLTPLDTGTFTVPSPRQVALRQSGAGFELFIATSNQTIEHHRLAIADGGVTFTARPSITVSEPSSGLAADDRTGQLYVAQPTRGVVLVQTDNSASFLMSIDAGHLGTAVGGLGLYPALDGGTLVFTTAPNESRLQVHSGQGAYLGTLSVGDVDGGPASLGRPDFLDVFAQPAPGFPRGVVVVEDAITANYKIISLADIDAVFPLPPSFAPPGPDAGTGADAGTDAGTVVRIDAGTGTGAGGGVGGNPGPPPSAEPNTPSCGCTGGPFVILPGLLLLWWIRRLRQTHS